MITVCDECGRIDPNWDEYEGHTFCECGAEDSIREETDQEYMENEIEDMYGESLQDLLDQGIDPL